MAVMDKVVVGSSAKCRSVGVESEKRQRGDRKG